MSASQPGGATAPLEEERLLTPQEAAPFFRVEPSTVLRWLRQGLIAGTRTPGGHWRVYASAVRRFLSDNAPGGSGPEGTREITHA
jgi:excisionase family DNA binding protein